MKPAILIIGGTSKEKQNINLIIKDKLCIITNSTAYKKDIKINDKLNHKAGFIFIENIVSIQKMEKIKDDLKSFDIQVIFRLSKKNSLKLINANSV